MEVPSDQRAYKEAVTLLDKQIDRMHVDFDRYRRGVLFRMPNWQRLERDLRLFSRRKSPSLELSNQLDRVLYKFQIRKRVWLQWVDLFQRSR